MDQLQRSSAIWSLESSTDWDTEREEPDWTPLHTRLSKTTKDTLVTVLSAAQMSHKTVKAKVFFIYEQSHQEASRNLTLEHQRN